MLYIVAGMNEKKWKMRMANTPVRTLRVDEKTWNKIQQLALQQETTVTKIVVSILREHLQLKGKQ